MPYHCVSKVDRALNDVGKPVRGSRIGVLGVSYKPGVGDVRESPALKILELLRGLGAEIAYHDAHVPEIPELELTSSSLEETVRGSDLLLIVTAHPGVDHDSLTSHGVPVVDLRGVIPAGSENLVRL